MPSLRWRYIEEEEIYFILFLFSFKTGFFQICQIENIEIQRIYKEFIKYILYNYTKYHSV